MVAPIASMRRVAEAFEKADLRPLLMSSPKILFGSRGRRLTAPDVLELTVEISAGYVFRQFVPKEIICQNDIVWGLFHVEGHYMPPRGQTRQRFQFECAIRWRVQGERFLSTKRFLTPMRCFSNKRQTRGYELARR
jgi:hypothetical protein